MGIVKEERADVKKILGRLKRKDFSGNVGQIVRNSTWQIATTLVAKFGSILFIIIIARLMVPEIFGLYGLAISTILFIGVFSDFGIGEALMTFISKTIDKTPSKAKGFFYYLTKIRLWLILFSSVLIILLAKWLAITYYQKPIYYALLAGAIYLPAAVLSGHLASIFISKNDFRPQFIKEVIIQIGRLVIVPIMIIYFLANVSSVEIYLMWIILGLAFCYGLGALYYIIETKLRHPFNRIKSQGLTSNEKKGLFLFIIPLSVTALSGIFFGYIDQIMLGHYVESQFLGYYQAAFGLITSASAIISFSAAAAFPIFARMKGKQLERGFKRTRAITFAISILAAIFTYLTAPWIIRIIYGTPYLTAVSYLRALSLLLISFPLINLYTAYYTSQKKTKVISIFLIGSTIINIVLNYIFITMGLSYSMFHAVLGACVATIISRYIYLAGLVLFRKFETREYA
jgi:stage V sporulation protein B